MFPCLAGRDEGIARVLRRILQDLPCAYAPFHHPGGTLSSFANVAPRSQQAAPEASLGDQDTSVVTTTIERLRLSR